MYWWYGAAFVFVTLCIVVWYSEIRMVATFKKVEADERVLFSVRLLYGLIKYELNIPIIRFFGLIKGLGIKVKQLHFQHETEDKQSINIQSLKEFYRRIQLLLSFTDSLKQWGARTLSHLHLTNLKWSTHVGVGEAPETAIAAGMVWSVKSTLIGYFFNRLHPSSSLPELNVVPQYNQVHFSTHFYINANIRLGHALTDAFVLLVRIMRAKQGLKMWRHVLFKPKPHH